MSPAAKNSDQTTSRSGPRYAIGPSLLLARPGYLAMELMRRVAGPGEVLHMTHWRDKQSHRS